MRNNAGQKCNNMREDGAKLPDISYSMRPTKARVHIQGENHILTLISSYKFRGLTEGARRLRQVPRSGSVISILFKSVSS